MKLLVSDDETHLSSSRMSVLVVCLRRFVTDISTLAENLHTFDQNKLRKVLEQEKPICEIRILVHCMLEQSKNNKTTTPIRTKLRKRNQHRKKLIATSSHLTEIAQYRNSWQHRGAAWCNEVYGKFQRENSDIHRQLRIESDKVASCALLVGERLRHRFLLRLRLSPPQ